MFTDSLALYISLSMIQFAVYRHYAIAGSYTDIIFFALGRYISMYNYIKLLSSGFLRQPDKFD